MSGDAALRLRESFELFRRNVGVELATDPEDYLRNLGEARLANAVVELHQMLGAFCAAEDAALSMSGHSGGSGFFARWRDGCMDSGAPTYPTGKARRRHRPSEPSNGGTTTRPESVVSANAPTGTASRNNSRASDDLLSTYRSLAMSQNSRGAAPQTASTENTASMGTLSFQLMLPEALMTELGEGGERGAVTIELEPNSPQGPMCEGGSGSDNSDSDDNDNSSNNGKDADSPGVAPARSERKGSDPGAGSAPKASPSRELKHSRSRPSVSSEGFPCVNEYLLLDELGRGQCGKVFLAQHEPSSEYRAIKMLSRGHLLRDQQRRRMQLLAPPHETAGDAPAPAGGGAAAALALSPHHRRDSESSVASGSLLSPLLSPSGVVVGSPTAMLPSRFSDGGSGGVGSGVFSAEPAGAKTSSTSSMPVVVHPLSISNIDSAVGAEDNAATAAEQSSKAHEQSNKDIEDFFKEVAIMKKLRHKNIVALYEVIDDPDEGNLYLVMQYIDGGPVVKIDEMGRCARIPEATVKEYLRQLLGALAYLHSSNIVHHDIKPDNILVAKNGTVFLADFGMSEMLDSGATAVPQTELFTPRHTTQKGTPAFMSPEMCAGDTAANAQRACDVWSLGVTVYCMLFGQLPFQGSNWYAVVASIREAPIPYPEDVMQSLATPEMWRFIFDGMLNKDPEKRLTVTGLRRSAYLKPRSESMLSSSGLLSPMPSTLSPGLSPASPNAGGAGSLSCLVTMEDIRNALTTKRPVRLRVAVPPTGASPLGRTRACSLAMAPTPPGLPRGKAPQPLSPRVDVRSPPSHVG